MCPPFFGSSSRIHPSSIGSSELLAAGGCAFVLLVLLIFVSGLCSPGLICCHAMSLRYVDLLSCGCAPTVWLATGFVAVFPSLSSLLWMCRFLWVLFSHMVRNLRNEDTPTGSRLVGSSIGTKVGSVSLSLLGWFFAMRSPFGSRLFSISFSIRTKNFLNLPLGGSGPSWWHSPFGGEFAVGLRTRSHRRPLFFWSLYQCSFSPRSSRMGFEALSEASLHALSLVVLTVAASLREFRALSSVLPFLGSDTSLAYVPQFGARSESLTLSIPRSFLVESLSDFTEGLVDALLQCPVRAICLSLHRSLLSILFA